MVDKIQLLLCCVVLLCARVAFGQAVAPDNQAAETAASQLEESPTAREARLAFEDGVRLMRSEAWLAAETRFRASLALVSRSSTAYNLAFVLFKQRRLQESIAILRDVLESADDDRYREHAQALVTHARGQLATLSLSVTPGTARVLVDGEPLSQTGAPRLLQIDPGTHSIAVSSPGFASQTFEIVVKPGVTLTRAIALERVSGDAPVASTSAPRDRARAEPSANTVGPWLTVGVGAALLAGAVVTGIMAKAADDEFRKSCPELHDCDPALRSKSDKALLFARVTDGLLVTGSVAVIGGLIWRVSTTTSAASPTRPRAALITAGGRF